MSSPSESMVNSETNVRRFRNGCARLASVHTASTRRGYSGWVNVKMDYKDGTIVNVEVTQGERGQFD